MRQLRLFKNEKTEFGGSLLENKRKTSRPIATNVAIHLIVKGDITLSKSLLKHRKFIDEELQKWSEKFQIKLHSYAINHNHIHMAIEVSTRESYSNFVRTFNGRSAQYLKIKWQWRPYTKLVTQGRHLKNTLDYIAQNSEEALRIRPYKPRKSELKRPILKKSG